MPGVSRCLGRIQVYGITDLYSCKAGGSRPPPGGCVQQWTNATAKQFTAVPRLLWILLPVIWYRADFVHMSRDRFLFLLQASWFGKAEHQGLRMRGATIRRPPIIITWRLGRQEQLRLYLESTSLFSGLWMGVNVSEG
jgi:hypothetical protein